VVLFALSCAAISLHDPHPRTVHTRIDLSHRQLFNTWKQRHSKVYTTSDEEDHRFQVFRQALAKIDELNAKSANPVFGLTKFADWTAEEFSVLLGYKQRKTESVKELLPRGPVEAPQTYDWRPLDRVTPVKDQAQCGSCWAFSATENIESIWMIKHNLGNANFSPLAPQQIVDCDTTDAGCGGGDTPTAFQYVISAGGQDTESSYPYTAEDGNCAFKSSAVEAKISSFKYATTTTNEQEMVDATVNVGPLSICVDAASWQYYTSGVFMASDCTTDLDHCVQIVGYDLTQSPPFWIVRNSWGADWGEKGFIRLEYGKDTCGLADEATSAVV